MRVVCLVVVLMLGGCVIGDVAPPELPLGPLVTYAPPDTPPDAIPPTPTLIAFTPPVIPSPPPKVARVERLKDLPASKPEPVPQPTMMIKDAHRAAQIEPQARGYHGQSATQRWIWQPGKLSSASSHV